MIGFDKKKWIQAAWQSAAILLISVATGIVFNNVRSDKLSLLSDSSFEINEMSDDEFYKTISFDDAKKHFFDKSAIFVDSRATENYEQGRIKGAFNFPIDNLGDQFLEAAQDIPQKNLIIVYCDGINCHLSRDAAAFLSAFGYNNVMIFVDGWTLWQKNNLPVEHGF